MALELDFGTIADQVSERLSVRVDRSFDYATPGELALALDPTTVQTPALDLIDDALVDVERALDTTLRRQKLFDVGLHQNCRHELGCDISFEQTVPVLGEH